jgi:hypothetical protein
MIYGVIGVKAKFEADNLLKNLVAIFVLQNFSANSEDVAHQYIDKLAVLYEALGQFPSVLFEYIR